MVRCAGADGVLAVPAPVDSVSGKAALGGAITVGDRVTGIAGGTGTAPLPVALHLLPNDLQPQ
jgi:hypothetical protein